MASPKKRRFGKVENFLYYSISAGYYFRYDARHRWPKKVAGSYSLTAFRPSACAFMLGFVGQGANAGERIRRPSNS